MKISAILLPFAFVAYTAVDAKGAIIDFIYQGQDFVCPSGGDEICRYYDGLPGFQGRITVDSDLFPLPSVAGTKLEITYDLIAGGGDTLAVSVFGENQDFKAEIVSPDWKSREIAQTDPRFAFLSYEGIISTTLFGIVTQSPSAVRISVASDLTVETWYFDSGYQGGSNDFASLPGGDFYASGASSKGPGSWTVLVDGEAIPTSPVPLPAAALLMLASLGALKVLGSCRRRPRI
jgi:hypothetical protein